MMRFTLIDGQRGVSFVAPHESLPLLVAACSHDPITLEQYLEMVSQYDPRVTDYVTSGLAVFDEHNLPGHLDQIHRAFTEAGKKRPTPVFRILDETTRAASLEPYKWGLVLFNVPGKRIVQIQNTYSEIRREGRIQLEGANGPRRTQRYRLPVTWRIVP